MKTTAAVVLWTLSSESDLGSENELSPAAYCPWLPTTGAGPACLPTPGSLPAPGGYQQAPPPYQGGPPPAQGYGPAPPYGTTYVTQPVVQQKTVYVYDQEAARREREAREAEECAMCALCLACLCCCLANN
ncbi:hypothetical protein Bbelb_379140 [Branchiostoma belcheri]|nr:hypothetical protein Bbelb_379140 [Branchiostoma belcheri]